MAEITLGIVLAAVLIYHAWFAHEAAQERHELTRELTNLAVSRTPQELRTTRMEVPSFPTLSELPEGYEGGVGGMVY